MINKNIKYENINIQENCSKEKQKEMVNQLNKEGGVLHLNVTNFLPEAHTEVFKRKIESSVHAHVVVSGLDKMDNIEGQQNILKALNAFARDNQHIHVLAENEVAALYSIDIKKLKKTQEVDPNQPRSTGPKM